VAAARSGDARARQRTVAVCRRLYERGLIAGGEVVVALGPIALVPYSTLGTEALADSIEPFAAAHDVLLLANHGATTLGPTVEVAYSRMESLEHSARILLAARLFGRVRTLTAEQVRDLVAAREGAGYRGRPERGTSPGRRAGD
jgi:ribulose-5-phosphate 4-epimerase/fuculose-1-phosphate aldolase